MRQITINGRDFNIGYNMATSIAYERLTGKSSLELEQFQDGKVEPIMYLGYAMLISCNDPAIVPDMSELMRSMTDISQVNDFTSAVVLEFKAYFQPLLGDQQPEDTTDNDTEEETPKKA